MTDDLISREPILKRLHDVGGCGALPDSWADGYGKAIDLAFGMVENEQAVDAIPVVRCKDCNKKFIPKSPKNQVWCQEHRCYKKPDDFCSCGERRTDNGTN